MRGALVEIFAASRSGNRVYEVFEEEAGAGLKEKFGRTFPQYFPDSPTGSIHSLRNALLALLNLIEHDVDELSNGKVQLGPGERETIGRLQVRVMRAIHTSS